MKDVYRLASHLVRDADKAADATQETFLQAWKAFDRFQPGTNCKAWMFTILVNVIRQQRRQSAKWITISDEEIQGHHLTSAQPLPDRLTDEDILSALGEVPEGYREVLLLVDVQEFSYKEAAGVLGIPIGTVMSRLSRGRTLLRDRLSTVAELYGIRKVVNA